MAIMPRHDKMRCGLCPDWTCDRCFPRYYPLSQRPALQERLESGHPELLPRAFLERLAFSMWQHPELFGELILQLGQLAADHAEGIEEAAAEEASNPEEETDHEPR